MEYIKKEDLIKGEVYNSTTGSHIFKYVDKNGSNNFYCNNRNSFGKEKATIGKGLDNIINATPEEKHWLKECIKLDKFITFEEAMKSFIPEYVECIKQLIGSVYKLGMIYKVNDNGFIKNDSYSFAHYNYNQDRFKPSTKEAYDAQFVVKEPEFVLPEKWCIEVNNENKPYIKKYRESINYKPYEIENYFYQTENCGNNFTKDRLILSLKQFKKYVLKEEVVEEKVIEPLPQFKVIETIETITKVENNEGNQFFIGDIVKSDSEVVQTIKSFRYNVNKTNILATTNVCNQISIARLEHYIEPKVEVKDDFILPENWHIVITKENVDIVKKWWDSKNYGDRVWSIGACYGIDSKDCISKTEKRQIPFNNKEITFDQFKKYVLKENIVGEPGMIFMPEETLLEKAKRLYPIGTKVSNYNLAKGCTFKVTSKDFYEDLEKDVLVKCPGIGNYTVYSNDKWADIIE